MPILISGTQVDMILVEPSRKHVILTGAGMMMAVDLTTANGKLTTFGETGHSFNCDFLYDGISIRLVNNETFDIQYKFYNVLIKARMEI